MNRGAKDMEDKLKFIETFATTISKTFQQFSLMIRAYMTEKMKETPAQRQQKPISVQQENPNSAQQEMQIESEKKASIEKDMHPISSKAFTLFVGTQRMKIIREHVDVGIPKPSFQQITCLAAKKWAQLAHQEKEELYEQAREMQKRQEERKARTDTLQYYELFSMTKAEMLQQRKEERLKKLSTQMQNEKDQKEILENKEISSQIKGNDVQNVERQSNPEQMKDVQSAQKAEDAKQLQTVEQVKQSQTVENVHPEIIENASETAQIQYVPQEKGQDQGNHEQQFGINKESISQIPANLTAAQCIEEKDTPKVSQPHGEY